MILAVRKFLTNFCSGMGISLRFVGRDNDTALWYYYKVMLQKKKAKNSFCAGEPF